MRKYAKAVNFTEFTHWIAKDESRNFRVAKMQNFNQKYFLDISETLGHGLDGILRLHSLLNWGQWQYTRTHTLAGQSVPMSALDQSLIPKRSVALAQPTVAPYVALTAAMNLWWSSLERELNSRQCSSWGIKWSDVSVPTRREETEFETQTIQVVETDFKNTLIPDKMSPNSELVRWIWDQNHILRFTKIICLHNPIFTLSKHATLSSSMTADWF